MTKIERYLKPVIKEVYESLIGTSIYDEIRHSSDIYTYGKEFIIECDSLIYSLKNKYPEQVHYYNRYPYYHYFIQSQILNLCREDIYS